MKPLLVKAIAAILFVCARVIAQQDVATGSVPVMVSTSNDICRAAAGHYEKQDLPNEQIVTLFEQAARDKDARATMWLARLYFKGRCSLPQRPEKAQEMAASVITNVTLLAQRGDVEAEFLLGSACQEGLGRDIDLAKAVQWYTPAAAAGHLTAMNNLAVLYAHGHGTRPDIRKARKLFAVAGRNGSILGAQNAINFQDCGRDDTGRMRLLRTVALVQALGMQKTEGLSLLVKQGLLADAKASRVTQCSDGIVLYFKADGILLRVDLAGRIVNVEGYVKGVDKVGADVDEADSGGEAGQYRGALPLGLTWEDTATSAWKRIGPSDDAGDVESDAAYGMAYRVQNVFFAVMFSYEEPRTLKLWRVYEKWAENYSAHPTNAPSLLPDTQVERR